MYAIATCRASILRGSVEDRYGDEADTDTVVEAGLLANISQTTLNTFDPSTGQARQVRTYRGILERSVDVRTADRLRDDTHSITYTINNVTRNDSPGLSGDVVLELERVTA